MFESSTYCGWKISPSLFQMRPSSRLLWKTTTPPARRATRGSTALTAKVAPVSRSEKLSTAFLTYYRFVFICVPWTDPVALVILQTSTSAPSRASARTETVWTHWAASSAPASLVWCWRGTAAWVCKTSRTARPPSPSSSSSSSSSFSANFFSSSPTIQW